MFTITGAIDPLQPDSVYFYVMVTTIRSVVNNSCQPLYIYIYLYTCQPSCSVADSFVFVLWGQPLWHLISSQQELTLISLIDT